MCTLTRGAPAYKLVDDDKGFVVVYDFYQKHRQLWEGLLSWFICLDCFLVIC